MDRFRITRYFVSSSPASDAKQEINHIKYIGVKTVELVAQYENES